MNETVLMVATNVQFVIPACFVIFYIWMWLTSKNSNVPSDYIFKNSLVFSLFVGGIVYLNKSGSTILENLDVNPADF